jgi:hypothetical protein
MSSAFLTRPFFLVEQFFEGVLHQALGEHLRGVVACAFLPVAARQAVNEAALGVHAQLAAAVFNVVDLFVVFVIVDAAAGDEPSVLQHVGVRVAGAGLAACAGAVVRVITAFCVFIAFVVVRCGAAFFGRGFHFVQVFVGKEAPVAEQCLVHGAQLVDGQQLVADAARATAPALAFAEREQLDDALPHGIGELHLAQQGHGGIIKQAAVERGQGEGVFGALQGHLVGVAQAGLLTAHAAAMGHELEQAAQGEVEVFALARLLCWQGLQLQVAQALQAVALEVDLAFVDGHVAQLGPRLDVEHEQQAVHHAQAFEAEHAGIELVLARIHAFFAAAGLFVELAGGFVAQQFNGFAQGVFQILADAKGVFVGVFVQALQQAVAFAGGQAVLVQERGAGLRVSASLRSRMSAQSKRRARLLGHL